MSYRDYVVSAALEVHKMNADMRQRRIQLENILRKELVRYLGDLLFQYLLLKVNLSLCTTHVR